MTVSPTETIVDNPQAPPPADDKSEKPDRPAEAKPASYEDQRSSGRRNNNGQHKNRPSLGHKVVALEKWRNETNLELSRLKEDISKNNAGLTKEVIDLLTDISENQREMLELRNGKMHWLDITLKGSFIAMCLVGIADVLIRGVTET